MSEYTYIYGIYFCTKSVRIVVFNVCSVCGDKSVVAAKNTTRNILFRCIEKKKQFACSFILRRFSIKLYLLEKVNDEKVQIQILKEKVFLEKQSDMFTSRAPNGDFADVKMSRVTKCLGFIINKLRIRSTIQGLLFMQNTPVNIYVTPGTRTYFVQLPAFDNRENSYSS